MLASRISPPSSVASSREIASPRPVPPYLRAVPASKLRCRHAGLNRKLLHSVGDTEITQRRADLRVHIADAIEEKQVRLRARSAYTESPALLAWNGRCRARCE